MRNVILVVLCTCFITVFAQNNSSLIGTWIGEHCTLIFSEDTISGFDDMETWHPECYSSTDSTVTFDGDTYSYQITDSSKMVFNSELFVKKH